MNGYRLGVLEGEEKGERFDFIVSLTITYLACIIMASCVYVCVYICMYYPDTMGKDSLSIT